MTVPVQMPITSAVANGVTTVFPYQFKVARERDLNVTIDGTTAVLDTDYTMDGVGDDAGGNVTFVTAPADGAKVILRRVMAFQRETNYATLGDLLASTLNFDQDDPVMMIQQLVATTMQLVLDSGGEFVWDAQGHRITHVGDPQLERDAVNQRTLLQAIGDFEALGLNTAPKFWEFTGDGTTKQFYLPGADIGEAAFYDVYVAGVGIEPVDGFTTTVETNPDDSHINFTTAPANAAECWVVLRGYAKPAGFDLISNQTFIDLVHSIVQSILDQTVVTLGAVQSLLPQTNVNSSGTIDKTRQSYLLRGTNPTPITLTIRANSGDPDRDWREDAGTACYFSVLQRGDGAITVAGDPAVTILVPAGYLPKPRAKGSTITLTGDNVAAGQWVCSGDMALDLA